MKKVLLSVVLLIMSFLLVVQSVQGYDQYASSTMDDYSFSAVDYDSSVEVTPETIPTMIHNWKTESATLPKSALRLPTQVGFIPHEFILMKSHPTDSLGFINSMKYHSNYLI